MKPFKIITPETTKDIPADTIKGAMNRAIVDAAPGDCDIIAAIDMSYINRIKDALASNPKLPTEPIVCYSCSHYFVNPANKTETCVHVIANKMPKAFFDQRNNGETKDCSFKQPIL